MGKRDRNGNGGQGWEWEDMNGKGGQGWEWEDRNGRQGWEWKDRNRKGGGQGWEVGGGEGGCKLSFLPAETCNWWNDKSCIPPAPGEDRGAAREEKKSHRELEICDRYK